MVFLRIHRKSRRKRQAKACDRSVQPVVYITLVKTSDEWLSRIQFDFVTARSFTADGGPLQPTGCVKTTPQKTRFRDVKYARIWDIA